MFINLDDTILVKKLIKNFKGYKIWINTHGSKMASNSNMLIPLSSYFETEAFFFNIEGKLQKTSLALNSIGDARSLETICNFFYYFCLNKVYLNKNLNILLNYKNSNQNISNSLFSSLIEEKFMGIEKVTNIPLKSNLEDFYLSSGWSKSSSIMAQCSYLMRKSTSNFIF